MDASIRNATVMDDTRILELINSHAAKGLMLSKTPYKIYCNIQSFFVAEDSNGKIIGCAALSVMWKDVAEVTSLAVDNDYFGKGVGKALVEKCIERARALKIEKLIALTYQDKFFERLGFKLFDKDAFPRKLWRECLEFPKLEMCDEKGYMYIL